MAETISIAGKKVPKKTVVYGAGAVAVGFVGYAWLSRGTSGDVEETPIEEEIPEPVPVPTDDVGFSVTGGGPRPTTNGDWSKAARDEMINLGHSGTAVSSALGEFLARRPLSPVERDLVQQAVSIAGYPPENGPWVILDEPLPIPVATADAPGPVRNLMMSASRTQALTRWSHPNTGGKAAKFRVEFFGGTKGGGTFTVSGPHITTGTSQKSNTSLKPNTPYGARVTAIGVNGKVGPTVVHSAVRTMK